MVPIGVFHWKPNELHRTQQDFRGSPAMMWHTLCLLFCSWSCWKGAGGLQGLGWSIVPCLSACACSAARCACAPNSVPWEGCSVVEPLGAAQLYLMLIFYPGRWGSMEPCCPLGRFVQVQVEAWSCCAGKIPYYWNCFMYSVVLCSGRWKLVKFCHQICREIIVTVILCVHPSY